MRILLLSATDLECRSSFDWLEAHPELPVTRLVSGVGQMAAAVALQKQVLQQRPDLIVQAGIAGASSPGDIGQVFTIDSEILADLGADETTGFRDLFELSLADPRTAPFSQGKLINPWQKVMEIAGLARRPGLTVNQIATEKKLLETRKQKYPLFVESMEGAALHYVALQENIPVLQIRAISNETGERDKTRWKMKDSIAALNTTLQTLIQKLINTDETHFRV